jgi:hypothetical protein
MGLQTRAVQNRPGPRTKIRRRAKNLAHSLREAQISTKETGDKTPQRGMTPQSESYRAQTKNYLATLTAGRTYW